MTTTNPSPIVETHAGKVQGEITRGVCRYRGIPYATPPVGERRWTAPEACKPWTGVRDATKPGLSAPQNDGVMNAMLGRKISRQSEDCLFLDVWTPSVDNSRRPVMVWMHGGAFSVGTGSTPIYAGYGLLERGVVLVTLNYRLGALGFLRLCDVTEGRIPATGNEGLLDQKLALRWVRDNIDRFGGDPDNITIFGESAGGMSVGCHLGIAESRAMFHRAILQSGACHTVRSAKEASFVGEGFVQAMGGEEHLVGAGVDELLAAHTKLVAGRVDGFPARKLGMPFQPVIDETVLSERPLAEVAAGATRAIPLLVGTTLDEWTLLAARNPRIEALDEPQMKKRLGYVVGADVVDGLVGVYEQVLTKRGIDPTPPNTFIAIQTDRIFRIPAIRALERQSAAGGTGFSYLFDWESPFGKGMLRSAHAVELGFVFGTHSVAPANLFFGEGEAADRLANAMMDAWTAFAKTGDPGWGAYDSEKRTTRLFGETTRLESAPHDDARVAWDAVGDDVLGAL